MRLPNGYGSIIKMGGKRRRPFAVRTSEVLEYVDLYAPYMPPPEIARRLRGLKFRWSGSIGGWTAISSEASRLYAIEISESMGYSYEISYRQKWIYHAYFEKRDMAYAYLAEMNSGNVVKEQQRFTDCPTFAEMYGKWKKYRKSLKKQISESTWRNYEIAFNHLAPLHHKKFIALTVDDIQAVLNSYNHKSATTIGSMRAILKGLFTYARMNEYAETDLTEFLVYEWTNTEEEIHAPYTQEEIALLWKNLYEVNNVDIVLIYIYTGMRPSELLNILTENVHLDEQYMVGGEKTESGRDRIIPIADKILPLVKNRYDPDRKYLINNRYGNHYTYKVYNSANFVVVMRRLGLQHLPHDARHTFATLMDNAGANDTCTKMIMGHSLKGDITKGVYTHKTVQDLLAEVNKI